MSNPFEGPCLPSYVFYSIKNALLGGTHHLHLLDYNSKNLPCVDLKDLSLPRGEGASFHINASKTVAVGNHEWLDMDSCPRGVKVLLLGLGNSATVGSWNGKEVFWKGWYPIPKIPASMK